MKRLYILYSFIAFASSLIPTGTVLAQSSGDPPPPPPPAIEYSEKAWKTFVSSEAGFSVLMPGQPEERVTTVSTKLGELPSLSLRLKTGSAEYMVTCSDFPVSFADPIVRKAAYDGGRDNLVKKDSVKLVNEREISLEGYTGRHITVESKGQLVNVKIIAVNKRLYQAMIVTRDYRNMAPAVVNFYETIITKFLNSLRFINGSEVSSKPLVEKAVDVTSADLGRIENSVYINDYFGFRVSMPTGWHAVERATNDATLELGREMVKGSDQKINATIDQSVGRTIVLFTFTKYPLKTPNVTHAVLQSGAERLARTGWTSAMYMESNKKVMLAATAVKFKVIRDVYPETIAGVSFSVLEMEQWVNGNALKQKYYGTIRDGYALFFVTTYFFEEDRLALENILKGIKFEQVKSHTP